MSKKAAGVAALACGNAACGKALAPPLLQCSKCKGEAYCCKACQKRTLVHKHFLLLHFPLTLSTLLS